MDKNKSTVMDSKDMINSYPLDEEEKKNAVKKVTSNQFCRNSTLCGSVPRLYEVPNEKLKLVDTQISNYCTGRRRKKKVFRDHRKISFYTSTNNASGDTMLSSYSVLNEQLSAEHSYGMSNNLSAESIKNACDFFDDERSDDDLIDVRSTPECFKNPRNTSKISQNPLCNLSCQSLDEKNLASDPETSFSTHANDCQQDDAISVLSELDAILDVHEASQLTPSNILETKIEDCLLDLDNYLEKMDGDSVTNSNTEEPQDCVSFCRHRSFSLNRRMKDNVDTAYENDKDITASSNDRFSRGLGSRKTICYLNENKKATETPQISCEVNGSGWHNLLLNTEPFEGERECTSAAHRCILAENANKQVNSQKCEEASIADQSLFMSRNGELRRCFSQNDFRRIFSSANPNEMLTQENILQNLLAQNESSSETENRPRQFGRRAEPHVLSVRPNLSADTNNCVIVNINQRPLSAPAVTNGNRETEGITASHDRNSPTFIGSETSSVHSSHYQSPDTTDSSSDSTSTAASTNGNIEINLVNVENIQDQTVILDPVNTPDQLGNNCEWPHNFSRALALICCTLGLFNVCRFSVLTINYGGNFLLQFILLSVVFGIPMLWLHMCLGSKIKSGPVGMWKISPICKGIGIALMLVQCFIAIYSTVAIAWLLIYLRDSFSIPNAYRWQETMYPYKHSPNNSSNLTECVGDYFNVVVLQRLQFVKRIQNGEIRFRVSDRLAFNLVILWTAVFLILCRGLKSFGKVVFTLATLPISALTVLTCKLFFVVEPSKLQNIFSISDFDDFLINSKTWAAAAQEVFLTWGLLGSSVIAVASCSYKSREDKTALRRDAILVVLITLVGLSMAALLGIICLQILKQNSYIYVPGSFEHPESYASVFSLKSPLNTDLVTIPPKLIPHYSSFIGETYKRPVILPYRESGYQALRFISEIFPAVMALCIDSISWGWTVAAFAMFTIFGLSQLCVMWKPLSTVLGDSTSSVLLSCVAGLLLGIPFTTEVGISVLHYMDLLIGGSWFIPILWAAQIFGVFLIRGRPYNGDDLVNDLKMSGSMSAFMALSWNVLLPIGLVALAVIDYKVSLSSQFYYWRGKSYFSYWSRKIAGLTQIGFLLLVPITAIVQIYRYLTSGPPDILDRIQLLYRPSNNDGEHSSNARQRNRPGTWQSPTSCTSTELNYVARSVGDDAPPKYTPPPSYTTATGARLAKIFRQSIRRSVRRILREPERPRSSHTIEVETSTTAFPPEYSEMHVNPHTQTNLDANIERGNFLGPNQNSSVNRGARETLSLGRKLLPQKRHMIDKNQRPSSAPRSLQINLNSQRAFTAEDVVTVLRSSKRHRNDNEACSTRELNLMQPQNDISFRSIENLILNAEPLDQSSAIRVEDARKSVKSNDGHDTSVI